MTPRRDTRLLALLAVIAGALTACGPTLSTDVGLKQSGAAIFFGQPTPVPPPAASPPLALSPIANFPAPLEEPPQFPGFNPIPLTIVPPATACPSAAPGAIIAKPTTPEPTAPPPPTLAPYPFRYSGSTTLDPGRPDMQITPLPPSGTRKVSSSGSATVLPSAPGGGISGEQFTVTEEFNGKRTINVYLIVPQGASGSAAAQETGQRPAAGLYLQQMVTENLDGSSQSTFTPDPPVELMPFPANTNINSTFESAGTDSQLQGGKTMVLPPMPGSAINGDAHVDACGTLLDAWQVTLNGFLADTLLASQPVACSAGAQGNTGSPGCTPFTLVLDIGTQYGALSLSDHLTEDGWDSKSSKPYVYDVTATIDREPGT